MKTVQIRVENYPADKDNPFGLRIYHLSEEISKQDGYWFYHETDKERVIQEFRKEHGFTPLIFSYGEAMENHDRVTSIIGDVGRDVIRWFAGTLDINCHPAHWPALEIVHAKQINVRLSEGLRSEHVDFALGAALEHALGMQATMTP